MSSNFTQPKFSAKVLFVPEIPKQTLIPFLVKKQNQKISTIFKSFLLVFCSALTVQMASAQLNLNFGKNVTLKYAPNGAKKLNAVYLYSKVNDTLDCIVTIKDISGSAYLTSLDNNDLNLYGGQVYRFQPIISVPTGCQASITSYIKFNFQLIKTGTFSLSSGAGTGTIITPSDPVWFRAYDIDGNGDNNSLKEFVNLSSVFTGTWVDAPTLLTSATPILSGGTQYTINNSTTNGNNLSDAGNLAYNGFIYSNTVSSWDIVAGATVGSNNNITIKHDSTDVGDGDRLNSWSFNYNEVVPGVDFGDAPASYNGTGTIVPAFHIVPSVASNVTVYLGSVKPDVDYDPSGNISATVDDKNNALDDEDGFQSAYFPKFSSSSTTSYTCTISATNTSGLDAYIYGYIDFNGDGNFTGAGEKSNIITVHSNSGALQYFPVTFSGISNTSAINTSNKRYARFRISSTPSEVASPTGKALNGEVEDYAFNTSLKISGTVYDDNNGITDNLINNVKGTVNGALSTSPTTPLYAVLVDTAGKVLQSTLVATNGSYALDSAGSNNTFKVILSKTNPAIASIPVLSSLVTMPTGFVYTSEGITSIAPAGDKLGTGFFPTTTGISDITTMDFGWDALPESDTKNTTINSPNSTLKYTLNSVPLSGSDPEDSKTAGSISSGGSFIVKTIDPGLKLYYNNVALVAGQTITSYNPSNLAAQFTTSGTKTFTYSTVDAAGKQDPSPATYTITSNNVLPLNDIVLSANQQSGVVKLTLVAKDENQVARYTWEQSTDGTNFTAIGSVAYQATNNVYTFSTTPTNAANTVYYRSVQYSIDGSTLISNIVAVKLNEATSAQAIAMPTVIKDITNIKISSATTQTININIIDNAGRMVMRKQTTLYAGSNTFAVDGWDKVANGSYYIQIAGLDNQSVLKVIVQH